MGRKIQLLSSLAFIISSAINSRCLLLSGRISLFSSSSPPSLLSFGMNTNSKSNFSRGNKYLFDYHYPCTSSLVTKKTTTITQAHNGNDQDHTFGRKEGEEVNYSSLEQITHDLLNKTATDKLSRQDLQRLKRCVNLWSQRDPSGGCARAAPAIQQERLLRRVIEEKMEGNNNALQLNMTDIYADLICCWSKHSNGRYGRSRAEEILMAMQDAYNSEEHGKDLKPTISSWNTLLEAHAVSKSTDATKHVIRIFSKLYQLILDDKTDAAPDHESYRFMLMTVASIKDIATPNRTLEVLNRMKNLAADGFSVQVTTSYHNVYLASLVESMKDERISNTKTAFLADSHLHKMTRDRNPTARPDTRSYNIVLRGWSKSGDRDLGRRAESLVKEMESSLSISPNTFTYNCLVLCYLWSGFRDKGNKALAILDKMKGMAEVNHVCRPDSMTYNSVMNCITKSSDPSPLKVEALLQEMNEIYESTGNPSLKPTNRSYNACVHAWARSNSRDAPHHVKKWIIRLQDDFESGKTDSMPNKWNYNSYLQALSKQRKPSSADEAERILSMMERKSRQFRSNSLKPDVLTYTNVLHCIALSKSDDAFKRAIAILCKMEEGDGDVRPNVYTYNVLINVVAKSKLPGKAKIAVRLVHRMKEVAIRPITITYNNALNACAYSNRQKDNRQEVIDIASMILTEAQASCGVNYITYSTYHRVVRYFVYDHLERWQLIRGTFRECCEDGELTPDIMKQMKLCLSAQQYELLVQEATDSRTNRLHKKYTVNAKRLKNQHLQNHQSSLPFTSSHASYFSNIL